MMAAPALRAVEASRLRTLTIAELLALELPPREYVLAPIIPVKGLAMLFAPRGAGKTYLALSLAYAVAAGGAALKWTAPKARRVLYIDGEMTLEELQARLAAVAASSEAEAAEDAFVLLAADGQEFGLPDLASHEGQREIDPFLNGIDLVVIDNLSTLVRSGKENEAESWAGIQEWLLSLRRRGIACLLVHHAGKDGRQRGTSKREDILDTVISLRHPADYEPKQGARFEVHLEKSRGITGSACDPFEALLTVEDSPDIRRATWIWRDLEDVKLHSAAELFRTGASVREVAAEIGISKSTADRLKAKAKSAGMLDA